MKEKEDEILKRVMTLELIRVQTLEVKKNEQYRLEHLRKQMVLAEDAKHQEAINFKKIEAERERMENLEMAEMETLSLRALEFERNTNLSIDSEEAKCILCEACCTKLRSTKKGRKKKKKLICRPHDAVLMEKDDTGAEFSDVCTIVQDTFSVHDLFDKQQHIASMGNYWLTEARSSIAECKGKELLHGIVAPEREDLI